MRAFWWYLAGMVGVFLLACAALGPGVAAHVDGCHRWHSCPSDDGSYVCGDRGHCTECPDNEFCLAGQARGAAATATRAPRVTRTPDPTNTPRPTRTPDPTNTPRPTREAASSAREGAETGRSGRGTEAAGAAQSGSGSSGATGAAQSGGWSSGATGAPLAGGGGAARGPGTGAAPAGPSEVVLGAELAGVRVLGPLVWTSDADGPGIAGSVENTGGEPQTLLLVLAIEAQGQRVGAVEIVLWDLLPGERRPFSQLLPPLAVPPTDVSPRLERLAP